MSQRIKQEITLFYCYARKDKSLRDELEKHLSQLKRQYHLSDWYDREILPGENWEQAIDKRLKTAHLILLLISPDFMASDYCYGYEMKLALERHKAGKCYVIPILLRPTYWVDAPFDDIPMLPKNEKPITLWSDRDEAFHGVVKEINTTIKALVLSLKTKEEWLEEGNTLSSLKRHEEALAAFEQAIRLDSNLADAYYGKGLMLSDLQRHEEALAAFEQVAGLNPENLDIYYRMGLVLSDLQRHEEALAAFEQAIHLDPDNAEARLHLADAYYEKGLALSDLKSYNEALAAFEQAIRLNPNLAAAYYRMGLVHYVLNRLEDALNDFEQAIHLQPSLAEAHYYIGLVLTDLKRNKEAVDAFAQSLRLNPYNLDAYKKMQLVLSPIKKRKQLGKTE